MNIAVVTETYPPEINGVARTLQQMVEGLRRRGHRITLVRPRREKGEMPKAEPGFQEILVAGVPIPRYSELQFGVPAPGLLKRAWSRQPPQIVYIATEGPLGRSALKAAKRLGIPTVSGFHTNFQQYCAHYGLGPFSGLIWRSLRRFHNQTGATLAPTASLLEQLTSRGMERVRVFPRGVDAELFHPKRRCPELRRAWGAEEGQTAVLHVGRLASEKNLALAIETFGGIRQVRPGAKFVLVGDGPQHAQLAGADPGFVLTGSRTGVDLAEHYASADIFLFPSTTETFGNVTLEAMASGLAIVAYDYAAAGEYLSHRQDAMLASLNSESEFVALARELAQDPQLATRLGRNARDKAGQMEWPRLIGELEGLFVRLTGFAQETSDACLAATNE
jgi:glycosyltransferase involved in cell wall biosynthesis